MSFAETLWAFLRDRDLLAALAHRAKAERSETAAAKLGAGEARPAKTEPVRV